MSRSRITGAALALLALCACGNPEREKKQQEVAAAEKKLAEAKTAREALEGKRARLSQQLTETRAQTDAARGAYHRTLAAAAYLAEAEGSELRPDETLRAALGAARSGFLLEEATRKKDSQALHALATGLLDPERPCVETKKEESAEESAEAEAEAEEGGCGPCEAEPYEDACKEVPGRLSPWPAWTCDAVTASGGTLPGAAFCRATFEYPQSTSVGESPNAVGGLATSQEVVRIAFEHGGRLYASDFPEPSDTLYHPTNTTGLETCAATTQQNACVHQCDVRFDRYEDPCACDQAPEMHDDDCGCGDGDEEESEESPAVREARLASEAAEAAVVEAQREAEVAATELKYQQCVAACEPEEPEEAPTTDADGNPLPPEPDSVARTARLEASPAPGIFVVTVETQTRTVDGSEIETTSSTQVLEHTALRELWAGKAPSEADTLSSLQTHVQFEDVLREGDAVSLAPLPGMKGATLVGLFQEQVMAVRFSTEREEEAVQPLEPDVVCEAMKKEPKRFPAAYLEACDEPPAPAPAPAPAVAAPVPAEADAGTEARVAGEVTP